MKNRKYINILIIGGGGSWAEKNHYPAIVEMKKRNIPVKVIAIVDELSIDRDRNKTYLQKILKDDNPIWISPFNKTANKLTKELNNFVKNNKCDAIIITTNPIYHYFYAKWALRNGINVLCDKPLVTTKDSAFNVKSAIQIQTNFEKLERLYRLAKSRNKNYLLCTPLRRRALTPFLKIANNIQEVHSSTGEGIRYMTVIVNGGLHRYPTEFLKGGAHGYLDGVGSLAHSSYHYIDIIAWYLTLGLGDTVKIKVELPYLFRVKNYLDIKGYKFLKQLIEGSKEISDKVNISNNIAYCELDFTFHLHLLDKYDSPIGLITYTSNHTSYTPRTIKYDKNIIDHANTPEGGRMSQLYIDLHQGPIQNWQLIKNDVVFHGNEITLIGRKHPNLGNAFQTKKYSEAYEKDTVSPQDLVASFIKYSGGLKISNKHYQMLSKLENQKLTNKLYSVFYELIAQDFEEKILNKKIVKINNIIEIKKYV